MCRFSIRPHHLLCLQFFEGKGYSEEFVKHMAEVYDKLLQENPVIQIVKGVDDICKNCPNNKNGKCSKEDSVLGNDKRTYELIKDELKEEQTWKDLTRLVYRNIIDKNKLKQVCEVCRWSDICESQLHKKV